jgi:hypothetical protein
VTVEGDGGTVWVGYQRAAAVGLWAIQPTSVRGVMLLRGKVTDVHPVWSRMTLTGLTVRLGRLAWRWDGVPIVLTETTVETTVSERPRVTQGESV